MKLRNAVTGSSLVKKGRDRLDSALPSNWEQSQAGSSHQIVVPRLDSLNAGGSSLLESWHIARQDIKSLKEEIERMKSKFSELEHDYTGMTQQVSPFRPHNLVQETRFCTLVWSFCEQLLAKWFSAHVYLQP